MFVNGIEPGRMYGSRINFNPRVVSCFFLVLICSLISTVQGKAKQIEPFDQQANPSIRADSSVSISTGESFDFYVSAYGFTAGNLHWSLDSTTYRGDSVFRVRLRGQSIGIANLIGQVKGKLTSYVDPRGGYSLGYVFTSSRRSKPEPFTTHFDYEKKLFVSSDGETGPLNGPTHDALSVVLYLRTRNLQPGRTFELDVQEGDSVERVQIKVMKRTRIATYSGWFDALECKISKKEAKKDPSDGGETQMLETLGRLWFSDDKRRIPLYITYPTRYGDVNAILKSYQLGKPSSG